MGNFSIAEVIKLEPTEKTKLKLNTIKETGNKNLVINDRDVVEDLIKMQKEEEVKDIETL